MAKQRIETSGMTPHQAARANAALDSLVRIDGQVMSWRKFFESCEAIEKSESDGMIDYSRTHFNRLDHDGQARYMARLKAKRMYYVNGYVVKKLVYDAINT